MKKWLSLLFTLTLVLVLAACGSTSKEENKDSATNETETDRNAKQLVVGASNVPHAEILEEAKPFLKKKELIYKLKHSKIMYFQTKR